MCINYTPTLGTYVTPLQWCCFWQGVSADACADATSRESGSCGNCVFSHTSRGLVCKQHVGLYAVQNTVFITSFGYRRKKLSFRHFKRVCLYKIYIYSKRHLHLYPNFPHREKLVMLGEATDTLQQSFWGENEYRQGGAHMSFGVR